MVGEDEGQTTDVDFLEACQPASRPLLVCGQVYMYRMNLLLFHIQVSPSAITYEVRMRNLTDHNLTDQAAS